MKKRTYKDYFEDILTSVTDIENFIKGKSFKSFVKDKKTVNATLRSLEIIGEAAKAIPDSIRNKNKDIPWKQMAGTRDKIIHEYFGVDYEMIWKVAKEELKNIKQPIENILKNIS